jgi:predicted oxidoreductase (fatty acid repression mutant protein)
MKNFIQTLENRRSIYALGRNTKLSEEEIADTIKTAIKYSPTAFNSQSSRALILFGEANKQFWDLAKRELTTTMKAQGVPESAFEATYSKLESFAAGLGTALMFEDQDVVKNLQENFALYAENFPIWSEQASGIATANAWVALSELGLGANLQHYNPVVDKAVQEAFNVPAQWKLRGQLVFGSVEAQANEKEFMNDDDRFRVLK